MAWHHKMASIFAGYRPKLCPGAGKKQLGWDDGCGEFLVFFSILVLMVLGEKLICGSCSDIMCLKAFKLRDSPKIRRLSRFFHGFHFENRRFLRSGTAHLKHLDMLKSSRESNGIFWDPQFETFLHVVELYIGYSFRCAGCTQFKSFCISNCSFCVFAMCWCADGLCMSFTFHSLWDVK